MTSQSDKMDKAKEVISKILDEEREYKLRELDSINERLQQTEENLDKLRSYLLGCLYTDQSEETRISIPKRYPRFEEEIVRTRRIVIGNVSQYIRADQRHKMSEQFMYKWLLYVRSPQGEPAVQTFVSKVVFQLDPTYIPNDVVELTEAPFEVRRRGWGEFPVKVKLWLTNEGKEVEVIHQLALDSTFSGLQTPGKETVIDVQVTSNRQQLSGSSLKDVNNSRTSPFLIE